MSLDFFVDLAVTGTVLGLDHTSDRATVRAVLGDGETSIPTLDSFGLVEFGWHHEGDRLTGSYLGAQTHRLGRLVPEGGVERTLVDHYGDFAPRLDIDDLLTACAARGFPLDEEPGDPKADVGCVRYRSPVTGMGAIAVTDPEEFGGRRAGDVLKLLGPTRRSPWQAFPREQDRFRRHAEHLVDLPADARTAWLDTYEPAGAARADWWRCLRHVAAHQLYGGPETLPGWRDLALALHRDATGRGLLPPAEATVTEVGLLAEAAELGLPLTGQADTVAGTLHDAVTEAVRRWLDTVTVAPAGAVAADVPTARALRDQIHEVERGLPWVTDPGVAARLRAWAGVKPLLLADFARPDERGCRTGRAHLA